jgi:hypothetical protein
MVNHAEAAQEKGVAQHAAMAGSFFRYRCGGWSDIHIGPVLSAWRVRSAETALANCPRMPGQSSNLMNAVKSGR